MSKPRRTVSKNWQIVQEHTREMSEDLKSISSKGPKETSEEMLRRKRELRKSQKERKLSNTSLITRHTTMSLPDRNSVALEEDSVLEDLCETTGVESRNNCSILR